MSFLLRPPDHDSVHLPPGSDGPERSAAVKYGRDGEVVGLVEAARDGLAEEGEGLKRPAFATALPDEGGVRVRSGSLGLFVERQDDGRIARASLRCGVPLM